MVGIDKYWLFCSFEEVIPIPEATHDGQEFSVIDGVILLCTGEFLGMETAQVSWSWLFCAVWSLDRWSSLIEYGSGRYLRCVDFQLKLFAGIWANEYWSASDALLEFSDCSYAVRGPFEWDIFSEESGNGGCDGGKSSDKHAVVSQDSNE